VTARKNLNYLIANGYYHFPSAVSSNTITTAGSATIGGALGVTGITTLGTANITAGTITTATLGGKAFTKKDINGGAYAGSITIAATDTAFVPVVDATTKLISPFAVVTYISGTHSNITADSAATVVASGNIKGATIGVSGTDTVTAAPVGSITYRAADSTIWVKIKSTGVKSARWNKVTVGK
jgi:hypothetical protein